MTNERDDFMRMKKMDGRLDVFVANGARLPVQGVGDVMLGLQGDRTVVATDVLFVPELDRKLLSVPALTAKGARVEFKNSCSISVNGKVITHGDQVNKLYRMKFELSKREKRETSAVTMTSADSEATLRHARLGHVGYERTSAQEMMVSGVPHLPKQKESSADVAVCEGCTRG